MAIYQATDGDNWKKSGGWGSDRPLGRWRGVPDNDLDRVGLEDCEEPEAEDEPEGNPGVDFSPSGMIQMNEGDQTEITVFLTGEPTADVSLELSGGPFASYPVALSPPTLTFTPKDWKVPQTVVVKAEQDSDTNDNFYVIGPETESDDERYSNRLWYDYGIAILDDD